MPRAKESTASVTAQAQQDAVADGIDNFELPRSLIMKLARASQVPENTKFSKEVILSILKASTVFINYLAATAHEVASSKQHKSISATDVLKALELVEFGDIAENIQGELAVYRELQRSDKRKGAKGKAKDASDPASASTGPKGKGKAKAAAQDVSEAQTETVSAHPIPPAGSASAGPSAAARGRADPSSDAEMDHEPPEGATVDVDEDQDMVDQDEPEDEEMDEDEDIDEDEDEGEDDVEPPEDVMALEEEELRKDAKGLDAHLDEPED